MLRSDIKEMLEGFPERMKFIDLVRSLVVTSSSAMPENIKKMTDSDTDLLNNLIMAVLLFIKEQTLGIQKSCSRQDIADFLDELRPVIPEHLSEKYDPADLADYIVTGVLQNGGRLYEYLVFDDKKEKFSIRPVRLVSEEKGSYTLTDDVFDFLYRSREIESELDYSVTRFKLAEYMKRQNYSRALDQSRELVERIRNLRVSMDLFIMRCRENLVSVREEDYTRIMERFTNLLESEYDELNDLEKNAELQIAQIRRAIESGIDNEDTQKNLKSLTEISVNLRTTVNEQRILINKEHDFSDLYEQIIRESFHVVNFEHMNFKKDVLEPLQKNAAALDGFAALFTWELTRPSFKPLMSVENFYTEGRLSDEEEKTEGIDLAEEDSGEDIIKERNERYRSIIKAFFSYASGHESFLISEFIKSLSIAEIFDMCVENSLPEVILYMYSLERIDIAEISSELESGIVTDPNGEFDLFTFIGYVPVEERRMREIGIEKEDHDFEFSVECESEKRNIRMTDMYVEVKQ